MNTIQKGLTTLMRAAVTGECLPLPADFRLEAAADIIRKQDLAPLVFQGALNCRLNKDTPILQHLRQEHLRQFFLGERQMRAVSGLFAAFEEAGIDYLPLKGCAIRSLYPSPELRPMGDADILIRREQYPQIAALMEKQGFTYCRESEYDYKWISDAAVLELHKSMVPPSAVALHAYFGDGWDRAVKGEGSRWCHPEEDTFLYLFAHMAKHFRSSGIGSRHFLDLFVFRRTHPDLQEARIEAAMARLRLLPFYRNVKKLLNVWFGDAPSDPVTDAITDYVFSGGNFGTMETGVLTRAAGESKPRSLLRLFFPTAKDLELRYPVLRRYPAMLPLVWLHRWWEAVFLRFARNRRRLGLMLHTTDEKVTQRQTFLRLTGLEEDP